MNTKVVMAKISNKFGKIGLKIRKRSPEILLVGGLVGVTASAVIACKATLKIEDITSEAKATIDKIHSCENKEEYSEQDRKKDLTIVYAQTGVKIVKLYSPALILGTASVVSILASNNILKQRNAAITMAYVAVDKGFKEYRARVVDKYGDEVDKDFRYGLKAEKVDTTTVDENGKEKKSTETIKVCDGTGNDFRFFFDAASRYWEKNGDFNRMFLMSQQQYANDQLRADGFLFLNDVLYSLGIPKTKAGQILGWVYDADKSDAGDGYVDFGIQEAYRQDEIGYVKEKIKEGRLPKEVYERTVLLDFNCDGPILNLI